jgi:hypothetical protein
MRGPATEIIATMKPMTDIRSDRSPSPRRRLALLGAVIAIAAVTTAGWNRPFERERRPDVMLLYIGAEDCAPCRAWQKGDRAALLASAELARITYREVRSPHLEDVLNDENWPKDIRDYRSRIRRSDGVPLWLVVADHAVVEQQFGANAWQERILPAVKSYLR